MVKHCLLYSCLALFAACLVVPGICAAQAPAVKPWLGEWGNTDASTRSTTKLKIDRVDGKLVIHRFGRCHPRDCDWGSTPLNLAVVTDHVNELIGLASWNEGFMEHHIILRLGSGKLVVESIDIYKDASGRANRSYTESFAKTSLQPGVTRRPSLGNDRLALESIKPKDPGHTGLFGNALPQPDATRAPAPRPSGDAGQARTIERNILPGGSVRLRYPDGTIRKLSNGSITTTRPDGSVSSELFSYSQPPTPPTAPPGATSADWLAAESDSLLNIMRTLVGDDELSIRNYLAKEGTDRTDYERIRMRTEAIDWLVTP